MPSVVINSLKQQLGNIDFGKQIWVAYSGGIDSHVLLHALSGLQKEYQFLLNAVHVHHGLSAKADEWATHCRAVCQNLKINCQVLTVKVAAKAKRNLEEAARNVRYEAFKSCIANNDYLATAHHADDQAETFLLQLLRGAGTKGLSAMPVIKPLGQGFLWRPLLSLPRDILFAYAALHELKWVEDESNAATHFDRNYLRHQVVSSLKIRWPHLAQGVSQSARYCAESELLIQELAAQDLTRVVQGHKLNLAKLRLLSRSRRHNVLRFWLKNQGFPLPGRVHLHQFEECFINVRQDACPKLCWSNIQLRRYLDFLYVLPNPYLESSAKKFTWNLAEPLSLETGTLIAEQKQGYGIRVDLIDSLEMMEVCFRQGGEVIQPEGYGHTRSLKKWLQDWKIPPWERGRIPLIYINGKLAQVLVGTQLCIAEQFAAKPGEMGWVVHFD
jgi:tRNA(Ile)-lysidine synthase